MHFATLTGTGIFDSVTTETLMGIFTSVTDIIPIVVPVVIAFIGFRKAWGFLKSEIWGV